MFEVVAGGQRIRKPARDRTRIIAEVTTFALPVDSSRTVDELIQAGKYDWREPEINSHNFRIARTDDECAIHMVCFSNSLATAEVLFELHKARLSPGTILELLRFGVKYPDEQLRLPVIALGSVWNLNGESVTPFLGNSVGRRALAFTSLWGIWDNTSRFAAIEK